MHIALRVQYHLIRIRIRIRIRIKEVGTAEPHVCFKLKMRMSQDTTHLKMLKS